MSETLRLTSEGPDETIELGRRLGSLLKADDVVALSGPLGSGKTTFSKGIALGLGVPSADNIVSPTYVLIQESQGDVPLFHIDAYRIEKGPELEELGIEEYWSRGGVCLVEWAERIQSALPEELFWIDFEIGEGEKRVLRFIPYGESAVQVLEQFQENFFQTS